MSAAVRVNAIRCLLSVFFFACEASGRDELPDWVDWKTVGHSTLRWGFWNIYDAKLKTPSGRYHSETQLSALVIQYRRAIDKQKLLKATDDQWRHLGIALAQREAWLKVLASLWVSVRKGDRLTFVLSPSGGHFYRGHQSLGQFADRKMAQAFMAIWLSKETAYPKLRLQLMGAR